MELKVGILVSPCPSLRPSPHYSPCYSPHYGLDAENWECGNILRVISALWLKCGYNADISPYSCPNTPIRIFSAFPPHFFPYKNTEISPRSCPNTPVRISSAFFFHIRMRRFLRVPVRILPSAFSPQGKCGDLGYGTWSHFMDPTNRAIKGVLLYQAQSTPKTIGILTKVFCTSGPNLVVLAWTGWWVIARTSSKWGKFWLWS